MEYCRNYFGKHNININSKVNAQSLNEEIIVQSSKLQAEGIYGAETYIINKSDIQNST